MRRFGGDIVAHWISATLFVIGWAGVWAISALTWHRGMILGPIAMQTGLPLAAGALIGWWRAALDGTMQRACWIAGAFVGWLNITILFGIDLALSSDGWRWDMLAIWFVVGAVFAGIGATLGMVGGVLAHLAVHLAGPASPPTG